MEYLKLANLCFHCHKITHTKEVCPDHRVDAHYSRNFGGVSSWGLEPKITGNKEISGKVEAGNDVQRKTTSKRPLEVTNFAVKETVPSRMEEEMHDTLFHPNFANSGLFIREKEAKKQEGNMYGGNDGFFRNGKKYGEGKQEFRTAKDGFHGKQMGKAKSSWPKPFYMSRERTGNRGANSQTFEEKSASVQNPEDNIDENDDLFLEDEEFNIEDPNFDVKLRESSR